MIKERISAVFGNEFLTILIIAMVLFIYAVTDENNLIVMKFFGLMTTIYAILCYWKLLDIEKAIKRGKIDSVVLEKLTRRQG